MFKISSKTFNHQRAVLKPIKDTAIYEEEEEEDEDADHTNDEDNSSSCHSNGTAVAITHDSRKDTMLLAQFLSSTGPEEYAAITDIKQENKTQQQFKRASRLLSRLRKKPTMPVLRSGSPYVEPIKKNHIPLPVYEPSMHYNTITTSTTTIAKQNSPSSPIKSSFLNSPPVKKSVESAINLRDSGIYSETNSDRDSSVSSSCIPMPPLPLFLNDLQQFPQPPISKAKSPRRPAPLPPAIASAAIATACSPASCSSSTLRSVPEAALKRKSVRLRHVQVQTEMGTQTSNDSMDKQACPHCRLVISPSKDFNRLRRPSCPPALSSGSVLTASEGDAKALMLMISKLKSQLAEEKQCRLNLEKAMYQRQSEDRLHQLAKEKDRWAGDCLWLNDRIALLPE
ncbi:hypothetical protein EDC94DRAFT_626611 [Helicostylum pulchrum]|uniref:Uncharacterized protein n=1 Tax=Helicostylum pulchrum TaxID=562976 RepID=A0ABP9YG33_9FUNG|nr:hypothetical protein EDC94DRAFT_626611 [Helicostylum pulchrum]